MSALAEHPSTASVSASATLVLGEADDLDMLVEEPIEFDEFGAALQGLPDEPEDEYPAGSGPYGF